MPMISFEYSRGVYSADAMVQLGQALGQMLHDAITHARPSVEHDYKVFVRGQAQGVISHDLPELEVVVRYHAEWGFSEAEIQSIGENFANQVRAKLQGLDQSVDNVKVRFYIEQGYQGFEV